MWPRKRLKLFNWGAAVLIFVATLGIAACGSGSTDDPLIEGNSSPNHKSADFPTDTSGSGWRAPIGKPGCPSHSSGFTDYLAAENAEQPVVPDDPVAGWICLYTQDEPPGENESLVREHRIGPERLKPILRFVAGLPPRPMESCAATGGGYQDALVLLNDAGEVFPLVVRPAMQSDSSEVCGVIDTPKGALLIGYSTELTRELFSAADQPFPG